MEEYVQIEPEMISEATAEVIDTPPAIDPKMVKIAVGGVTIGTLIGTGIGILIGVKIKKRSKNGKSKIVESSDDAEEILRETKITEIKEEN